MFQKIFISYTLRDSSLTKLKLFSLKKQLSTISTISTYIDLIDNNNLISPQSEVIRQLMNSNMLWIINSTEIVQSEWVKKEIDIAIANQKVIRYISVGLINKMLTATNIELTDLVCQYTQ